MQAALRLMSPQQRAALLDELSALFAGIAERWPPDSRSDFQRELVNELERITFRLRHKEPFRPSDDARTQKPYFVCIKCKIPIIAADSDLVCPDCGERRMA